MSLTIGKSSQFKGIFVNKAKIVKVEDLSHQTLQYINNSFDLAVKLTFDIGKSFNKEITFFGNFKRDADNVVQSLGAAFKVAKVFENLGIAGDLTPSNELPSDWLSAIVDKECYLLDYAIGVKDDGKTKFGSWDRIDTDKDFLLNDFLAEVKKGYPKKYVAFLNAADEMGDAYEGDALSAPAVAETADMTW